MIWWGILIIIAIVLLMIFGIPTIYDWIIFRGNHLSYIDRNTGLPKRGGRR